LTFQEFWPYYVAQHLNPTNRRLHFAGTTLGLICLGGAAWDARLIALGLVLAYGCAWVGHAFFERNKPATFKYPLLSFIADFKMYGLMWRGEMSRHLP
jgi:hypothetical protein